MPKSKIQRYLKNVDVQFISLVDSAANRREFIYKSAGTDDNPDFTTQFNIVKTDVEKQLVYGIVYAPDEADTDGDAMTAKELEKAAHHFMEKARTNNVDTQHDFQADDGVIVESYILGKSDSKFPDEKEGSWAVVIKVTDEETWDAVKKGDLKGISLAGKAVAEDVEKEDSKMQKFFKGLYEMFEKSSPTAPFEGGPSGQEIEKDFARRIKDRQLHQAMYAFQDEVMNIIGNEYVDDPKAKILEAADQFKKYISGLQLGGTTQKSETTMSTEEKEEQKKSAEQPEAEGKETKKSEESDDATQSKELEDLKKTIEDQNKRIEELEKAAPGRQSSDDTDTEEPVEKSNPKAPLNILGN